MVIIKLLVVIAMAVAPLLAFSQKKVVGDYIENIPVLHSNSESGWGFYIDDCEAGKKKKILFIGDSILMGYKDTVKDRLKDLAVIDCWITPIHEGVKNLPDLLMEIASNRDYDVIHFNIGLHGYQDDRVNEAEYEKIMTRYVDTLKKASPNASIVWSTITPVLEMGKTTIDGTINPVIERRNKKANKVIADNGVYIIDLYSLMMKHLSYSAKDKFHWNNEGKVLQGETIVEFIKSNVLSKK